MVTNIDWRCLRLGRKARGFTQRELSDETASRGGERHRVSERTIRRLEDPNRKSHPPRRMTILRLAAALDLFPEELTGEEPFREEAVSHLAAVWSIPAAALAGVQPLPRYAVLRLAHGLGVNPEALGVSPGYGERVARALSVVTQSFLHEYRAVVERVSRLRRRSVIPIQSRSHLGYPNLRSGKVKSARVSVHGFFGCRTRLVAGGLAALAILTAIVVVQKLERPEVLRIVRPNEEMPKLGGNQVRMQRANELVSFVQSMRENGIDIEMPLAEMMAVQEIQQGTIGGAGYMMLPVPLWDIQSVFYVKGI